MRARRLRLPTRGLALIALLCCDACGGDAPTSGVDAGITCRTDPRAEAYAPNQTRPGQGGAFSFVLVQSEPGPPAKGTNTWTVRVTTPAGQPVVGATLKATPFMLDHGHGTSIVPQTTAVGDTFTVAPLYLFMPGLWRITLEAQLGAALDSAQWFFCVEG